MNAFANLDIAPIGMFFPRNHAEKGCLPGPVGADETDPIPGSEPERSSGKKDFFPESFFQADDFDQDKVLEFFSIIQ
jgi:hypothetical protein